MRKVHGAILSCWKTGEGWFCSFLYHSIVIVVAIVKVEPRDSGPSDS